MVFAQTVSEDMIQQALTETGYRIVRRTLRTSRNDRPRGPRRSVSTAESLRTPPPIPPLQIGLILTPLRRKR